MGDSYLKVVDVKRRISMFLDTSSVLLIAFSLFDLTAIIGGYCPNSGWYWLADGEAGVLHIFGEHGDLENYFTPALRVRRDLILSFIVFCIIWSVMAVAMTSYFRNRRYLASLWPFTVYKCGVTATFFRIICTSFASYKLFYVLVPEIVENSNPISVAAIYRLFKSGVIGPIPLVILVTIVMNVIVLMLQLHVVAKISAWRRLNVCKIY